jgi:class 3 adenylate cyclase/HAMP domain-containing protein
MSESVPTAERRPAPPPGRRQVSFSLRLKITVTFLLVNAVVAGLLSFTVYRILGDSLLRQVQARVLDLAQAGARLVNVDAVARLDGFLDSSLARERVDLVEGSTDFRYVSDQLNALRDVEAKLVHYIYIFAPTGDPAKARYVVDGDVLPAREKTRGARAPEDLSHFGSEFDLATFPTARRALAERTPLVEDAWTHDPEFNVNSITGYAPLFGRNGQFLGALGIDMVDTDVAQILSNATRITLAVIGGALVLTLASSILLGTLFTRGIISLDRVVRRFDGKNLDARADIRTRDEVGRLGHSFNAMAETLQQYSTRLEALLSAYGRFVPHELLRLLKKGSILDVKLGDPTQKEMAVLFSDIIGFTTLSESMSPSENFNFLNSYLRRMGPHIRDAGGFIDKYIGDGIMALFPEKPDDALAAAVGMQEALVEYNAHRARSGYPPIGIGVGVNAGKVMLGTVGEHERMDVSVIADAVNLSSRLQGLTRVYGSAILTTGQTLKALHEPTRFRCRFIDRVQVRGKRETILLFEVLDGESPGQREKKLASRTRLAHALRMYYARDFAGAQRAIAPLARENPADAVLKVFLKRCADYMSNGVPAGWQGVWAYDSRH